ncbi:DUF2752 domain-containing protein [Streptacidiphilus monticola]|uniref:DUF2752 domain-containing protein n=1 Tax=Streptacidiphilus monticola TaxID=2161674 RepID=A0ABW1GCF2_9ACTN
MPTRRKPGGLAAPLAVAGAAAAAVAYVGAVDPGRPGHYPTCPFLLLTGWWCPGCGGLRAVHALTRGDVPAALHDNAFGVALLVALLLLWARWTRHAARGRPTPPLRLPRGLLIGVAVMAVAFTVLRNLPVGAFLAP